MGKSGKKPRQKLDPKKVILEPGAVPKKEKDWTFEDILRSKTHPRR